MNWKSRLEYEIPEAGAVDADVAPARIGDVCENESNQCEGKMKRKQGS